ncbi:low temperature requirement protein A [Micromonospora sp. NPDC049645]|uniref:low temperature requirement protein A n=1 Tax=Micromonospora sp. NPDC049645 TaxID=3155508 RepID=UPI003433A4E6
MTTGGTAALVRRLDGSTRATLLELLFDVVFVAALAQASKLLADQDSWTRSPPVFLMLTAIWWTWSVTSTTTEFYDPQQRPIQAILMVAMVGSVGMAAALPMVTGAQATAFALAYVGTHVVRGIVLVSTLYRLRHRSAMARATRFLFWFLVSGVLWIVGAVTEAGRWWIWPTAIVIDLLSAAARYPTPWLGRVPLDQYDRTTAHLGERYQQFVILALGDIILVPTLELSRSEFDRLRITALLCAFAIMLLLWQIYVYRAGELLETAAASVPGRSTRIAPYTHLVLLVGVTVTAASFDLVVDRPTGTTPTRWLMLIIGGPLVFVLGRALFAYLLSSRVPWRRVSSQLLPLLVLPWAGGWPPVLVTAIVALALAGHVLVPRAGVRETTRGLRQRRAAQ